MDPAETPNINTANESLASPFSTNPILERARNRIQARRDLGQDQIPLAHFGNPLAKSHHSIAVILFKMNTQLFVTESRSGVTTNAINYR